MFKIETAATPAPSVVESIVLKHKFHNLSMILKFVINFRYARSPPAGYRDASPQPHKIERRAPPPPRGPRTPPMSPSRRSKTMTPPPGEDGTPPPPPGTSTIQKWV